MLNFLLRHFVPDYQNTKDPSVRTRCGVLAGALGIVLNMFLFAFKLAVGLLSSSIAIVADAVNNLSEARCGAPLRARPHGVPDRPRDQ